MTENYIILFDGQRIGEDFPLPINATSTAKRIAIQDIAKMYDVSIKGLRLVKQ